MKYCPKCGAQNEDAASVCRECGSPIPDLHNAGQQQNQQNYQQNYQQTISISRIITARQDTRSSPLEAIRGSHRATLLFASSLPLSPAGFMAFTG